MSLDRCTRGQLAAMALAAAAIGLLPSIIRLAQGNPLMPGMEGYAHLLAARHLLEPGTLPHAPVTPYHALLAGLAAILGLEAAGRALAALTALLTLPALYHLCRSFRLPAPVLSPLVLLLSPGFIAAAALPAPRSLSVLAALAALLRLPRAGLLPPLAASLLLALAATTGLPDAAIAAALPILFAIARRQARRAVPALLPLAVLLTIHIPAAFAATPAAQGFFSEFGSIWGLSIFAFLLAVIGLITLRKERRQGLGSLILAAAVILAAARIPAFLPYATVLVALFAGAALQLLARMRWTLTGLRRLSLIIIFCGLLFAAASQVFLIARLPPAPAYQQGFDGIRQAVPADARIFSHPDQGLWLAYHARLQPAVHNLEGGRASDGLELLQSQDLGRTRALLAELGATHVMLTKDLIGTTWPRKGIGLHFLVGDGETFKRVYADDFMTVWQVRAAVG